MWKSKQKQKGSGKQSSLSKKDIKVMAQVIKSMHFDEYVDFISSPWRTFFFSFLKGTGVAVGALVGAAIIFALLTYIINLMGGIPILRDLSEVLRNILSKSQ